jgi:hypothetical protein
MKRDRTKINYIGFGSETTKKYDWFPRNVCSVRLRLNKDGDFFCTECGRIVTK